jgi:AAA15 family ATPase/GTPase
MSDIKLKSFTIKGYKTIKAIENFEPKSINILIGPNGAGKSNFFLFLRFYPGCLTQMENYRNMWPFWVEPTIFYMMVLKLLIV